MKKSILLFVQLFLITAYIFSQNPQYYNYNTTNAGNNTFPLGTGAGRMVQWLVLPGGLNQPSAAPSGFITKFYCQMAVSFGPFTYTNLNLILSQSTITDLPTSAFYTTSLDTVYHRASVQISNTGVSWLEFVLDHPFAYDNTKSLMVQLEHRGATGSATYVQAHTQVTGKKRTYSNTSSPFGVQGQDGWILNCGIVLTTTGTNPITNSKIPSKYNLEQNYPNPFNPETQINFDIPKEGFVTLKVYDIVGKEVATLVNENKTAGSYTVNFDASKFGNGTYFYRLDVNGFVQTKKMVLIK